jgi:hypothetical protein
VAYEKQPLAPFTCDIWRENQHLCFVSAKPAYSTYSLGLLTRIGHGEIQCTLHTSATKAIYLHQRSGPVFVPKEDIISQGTDKVTVYLFALDKLLHGRKVAAFEPRQLLGFGAPMRAQHLVCSIVWIGL